MNSELIALTFKGLCRRWREVVRVVAVVMISFMFVTGVIFGKYEEVADSY